MCRGGNENLCHSYQRVYSRYLYLCGVGIAGFVAWSKPIACVVGKRREDFFKKNYVCIQQKMLLALKGKIQ